MKDLLIDSTGFILKNNDLLIGYSNHQHEEHLLVSQKGEIKSNPDVGVGLANYINHEDKDELTAEVATEFTKDGMNVNRISYDDQTKDLDYDAGYNS